MKKIILVLIVCFLFSVSAYADTETPAMSLSEALAYIDAADPCPERILLTDDFSRFFPFSDTEYQPADGGVIVLWREAPLKAFRTSDTEYTSTDECEDLGDPCVYLCADAMKSMPSSCRAHTAEDIKNLFMVETCYMLSGQISSVINGSEDLPTMEALESVISGDELPRTEDDEELEYNYRPVFDGYALAALYDANGGAIILDGTSVPYSEMRSNPAADDVWQQVSELIMLYSNTTSLLSAFVEVLNLPEEDLAVLSDQLSDLPAFLETCERMIWERTEELKKLDPEAEEFYSKVILDSSVPGLAFLGSMRAYSGVDASDEEIIENLMYIGVPDGAELQTYLEEYTELLNSIEWSMTSVYEFI